MKKQPIIYFRVRHIPTGLYLGNGGHNSPVSEKGILYNSAAQANAALNSSIRNSTKDFPDHGFNKYEIEECELNLVKTHKPRNLRQPKSNEEVMMEDIVSKIKD